MVLRNGEVVEGSFVDGSPFGFCRKTTGEYCLEGKFVGFDINADVKIMFPDQGVFVGKLSFHQDTMTGTLTYPNQVEHTGRFQKFT